jgi:hypothetical protein
MNSGIEYDNRLLASCSSYEYGCLLDTIDKTGIRDLLLVDEMTKNEGLRNSGMFGESHDSDSLPTLTPKTRRK